MLNRFEYKLIFFVIVSVFTFYSPVIVFSQNTETTPGANEIVSINSVENLDTTSIHIRSLKPIVSTAYELPNPKRIVIDLANVSVPEKVRKNISIPFKYTIDSVKGTDPTIVRLELYPNDFESFTSNHDNGEYIISLNSLTSKHGKADQNTTSAGFVGQTLVKYDHRDNKDLVFINTGKNKSKYTTIPTTVDSKYALQIDVDNMTITDSSIGTIDAGGVLEKITIAKRGGA